MLLSDPSAETLGVFSGVCPFCNKSLATGDRIRFAECRHPTATHVIAMHTSCGRDYHSGFTSSQKHKRVYGECLIDGCSSPMPESGTELDRIPKALADAWQAVAGVKPTSKPSVLFRPTTRALDDDDDDVDDVDEGPVCDNVLMGGVCGRPIVEEGASLCRRCVRLCQKLEPIKSLPLPTLSEPAVVTVSHLPSPSPSPSPSPDESNMKSDVEPELASSISSFASPVDSSLSAGSSVGSSVDVATVAPSLSDTTPAAPTTPTPLSDNEFQRVLPTWDSPCPSPSRSPTLAPPPLALRQPHPQPISRLGAWTRPLLLSNPTPTDPDPAPTRKQPPGFEAGPMPSQIQVDVVPAVAVPDVVPAVAVPDVVPAVAVPDVAPAPRPTSHDAALRRLVNYHKTLLNMHRALNERESRLDDRARSAATREADLELRETAVLLFECQTK